MDERNFAARDLGPDGTSYVARNGRRMEWIVCAYEDCPRNGAPILKIVSNHAKYCSQSCSQRKYTAVSVCSAPEGPHSASGILTSGLCDLHYLRMNRHGDLQTHDAVGERAGNWKGDDVSYSGMHKRVEAARGAPSFWEHCETTDLVNAGRFEWAYNHEDPSEVTEHSGGRNDGKPYSLDINNYIQLCRPCHSKFDLASRPRGEDNSRALLSNAAAYECRERWDNGDGESQASLAREFDVSESVMWNVVHGVTYKELVAA